MYVQNNYEITYWVELICNARKTLARLELKLTNFVSYPF
jgi:hypothetical protein